MGTDNSTNGKIVVLLSDFGCRDGYAGIMKGAILSLDPGIRIVDLTHEVEPHNILSGAYLLYSAWNHFPRGSVFCAVVDPGVGSQRGTVYAEFNERTLIAPDNGLISLLVRMIPDGRAYALQLGSILELANHELSISCRSAGGGAAPSHTFHDRFGNCISSVHSTDIAVLQSRQGSAAKRFGITPGQSLSVTALEP